MKRFISIIIIVLSALTVVFAGNKQPRFDHIDADFKMTNTRGQMTEPLTQYGHFVYSAIAGVSVVYENSIEEEIPTEISRFIMKFLGSETIRSCTEYKVLLDGDMVTLYPKKQAVKQHFLQAQVFFNPLTGFVREVVAIAPSGELTTIEVFNLECR